MTGYTKLFSEIIESTIWQEPNDMRVLWITMLALKDWNHVCTATVPYLAKVCNISVEQCEKYLDRFQKPDKHSRNQAHEGRRIKRVPEGWFILNGEYYREKMSKEVRKAQVRKAVAKYREKKAGRELLGKSPLKKEHELRTYEHLGVDPLDIDKE